MKSRKPSPYTTPLALFFLGLHLLTPEERAKYWRYLVLTDFGRRYIPPEQQGALLQQLAQLVEEEGIPEAEFFTAMERLKEVRERVLQEGGGGYPTLFAASLL